MEYWILLCCVIFVVELLLWNVRRGLFVVESSLLGSCCGICLVASLCYIRCGNFVVEPLL